MLQHVTREIPPPEIDRSVDFYGLLGFEQVPPPPGIAGRAIWLERSGTQVHLMPVEDAQPASGHIGVVVDGYENTIEHLRSKGFEIDPRAEHWGSPRCYVRDPAGHLVELMAWPPSSLPAQSPPRSPG